MKESTAYTSIVYFITRACFIGMSFHVLISYSKQDAWISILISYILGILFVGLINYILSYQGEQDFRQTCKKLFPKSYQFIIIILTLFIFSIVVINFWNLGNLITSQFLSKTPSLAIGITFLVPIIYILTKKKIVIARVSMILFYFSILLFICSVFGLISRFEFSNFQPIFQNSILPSSFYYFGFNIGPLLLITLFPHKNYKKSIWKGYILSAITLIIVTLMVIGVLGHYLSILYQYPEFHILKNTYQGILNYQMENFLTIQWVFDIFIFCAVGLKWCNEMLGIKEEKKCIILPLILLILSNFIFKDNTSANEILLNYFAKIFPTVFMLIILLFVIKILIKKSKKNHA